MLRPGIAASLRSVTRGATPFQPRLLAPASMRLALGADCAFQRRALAASSLAQLPRLPLASIRPRTVIQRQAASQPDSDEEGPLPPPPEDVSAPSIPRALLFLYGFSSLALGGAALYSLRDTQHVADELRGARDVFGSISSYLTGDEGMSIWGRGVTEKRLQMVKKHETAERLGVRMQWLMGWCEQLHLPSSVTETIGRAYIICAEAYLDLAPSKQVVLPIVALNAAVFVAWTVAARRGGGWMMRNFLHRPSSNRMRTLLTSVFSHQTLIHFGLNNMALWSFGGAALYAASQQHKRVPEASPTPHFLAFFATAGVFAATVSHIVTAIRFRRVAALRGLDVAKSTVGRQASLGSSGAVYAALVMSACAFPDAKLGIILLPFVTFPIGVGVAGLVALDVAGIVLRWRLFDHWAHLAGAAFGYAYFHVGAKAWEDLKLMLLAQMRAHK